LKRNGSSSRYIGVTWNKAKSSWRAYLRDPPTKRDQSIGYFASEEDAARAYDCAAVQAHGPDAKRNFPGEDISELPVRKGEERKQRSSRYVGISWNKGSSSWRVRLTDTQTKRSNTIGNYVSEEDAARAYDCAAVQARGPGVKRNFPGEAISELPVSKGEERKQRQRLIVSPLYIGVRWDNWRLSWFAKAQRTPGGNHENIGYYASEEDAARAYDFAAVQVHGAGTRRNFPDETITEPPMSKGEPPVPVGEKLKQCRSSRFIGVGWHKADSSWHVRRWHRQTRSDWFIGRYASEEDAARAYDRAEVQARGPGSERYFPGEAISEAPVSVGGKRRRSSRYNTKTLCKAGSSWEVKLWESQTKRERLIGSYASEEDATRAYDECDPSQPPTQGQRTVQPTGRLVTT
jgi:hypothetical protein